MRPFGPVSPVPQQDLGAWTTFASDLRSPAVLPCQPATADCRLTRPVLCPCPYTWTLRIDDFVKSPFLLDLGIQGLRNYALFKALTTTSILKNGQIATSYETIRIDELVKSQESSSFVIPAQAGHNVKPKRYPVFSICYGLPPGRE